MFTLDQVVPWGRSFDEYRRMFALSDADLAGRIVGCGDGPAAFNAEATRRGSDVLSCDPLYRFEASQIESRIAATCDVVLEQASRNAAQFVWAENGVPSVEALGEIRMKAMRAFLDDFPAGKAAGRYLDASLPDLPLPDGGRDLALSSHFLFLYSEHLDEAFHLASLREMCRVAAEVRVFPLVALDGRPSRSVEPCARALRDAGFDVSIERVPYEFQRGGDRMLRVRR